MTLRFLQAFRDKAKASFEIKTTEDWVFNGENSIQTEVPDEAATFEQVDALLEEIDTWIASTYGDQK